MLAPLVSQDWQHYEILHVPGSEPYGPIEAEPEGRTGVKRERSQRRNVGGRSNEQSEHN